MRKLFTFCLFVCALFAGCSDSDDTAKLSLQITSSKEMYVDAEGGDATITFSCTEGAVVEAKCDDSWITAIEVSASEVHFEVLANDDVQRRTTRIELSAGDVRESVLIVQEGAVSDAPIVVTSGMEMNFKVKGGRGEITYILKDAQEGDAPEVEVSAPWIENVVAKTDCCLFNVAANDADNGRQATIDLTYSDYKVSVAIVQAGKVAELRLSVDSNYVSVGEPVAFRVVYNGEDVTESSNIYEYTTNAEVNNPYTFTEAGEKVFYAMYDGLRSKVCTITAVPVGAPEFVADTNPDSFDFHYRMLLIDHTGTDCPNCPAVMSGLKALSEDEAYCDKYSLIMVHSYNTSDPAFSITAQAITRVFENEKYFKYEKQLTGYPSVTANFCYGYIAGANNFMSVATRKIDELWIDGVDASVAASAALVGDNVIVSASVKSAEARHYHIAAWLMEDGIYGRQSGAREEWQNTHNNAFRACAGVIEGDDLSGIDMGYVQSESITNKILTIPVKESWDSSKLRVLLIISTPGEDGRFEVVNTAICSVGGSVGFEYNN